MGPKMLADHWEPTFAACDTDYTALSHLLEHVPEVDLSSVQWIISEDEFYILASRAQDSAPGPDGVPYSGWTRAPLQTLHVLYWAYCELLNFNSLPSKRTTV